MVELPSCCQLEHSSFSSCRDTGSRTVEPLVLAFSTKGLIHIPSNSNFAAHGKPWMADRGQPEDMEDEWERSAGSQAQWRPELDREAGAGNLVMAAPVRYGGRGYLA